MSSGSTFSARVPRPVGASHSSQARPSAINASVDATASARVLRTAGVGARASSIAAYDASNVSNDRSVTEPLAAERWITAVQAWPWLTTAKTLARRFREDRLALTAGGLTFTTIISLVPLITVMLALFSAFPMFSSLQEALQRYFLQTLVPDTIAKPVLVAISQFSLRASRLGLVGLIALFVSALAMMLTIDHALNAIWRVRKPRAIAQRVLVYWAAVTLGPLVLGLGLSLTSYAISASQGVVARVPGGVAMLLHVLEFTLLATSMGALFRYVPNTHV